MLGRGELGAPAALPHSVWGSGRAGQGVAARDPRSPGGETFFPEGVDGAEAAYGVAEKLLEGVGRWELVHRKFWGGGLGARARAQEGVFWVPEKRREGQAPHCSGPREAGREAPSWGPPKEPLPGLCSRAACVSVCARRKWFTPKCKGGGRSRQPRGSRSPEEETGVGVGTGEATDTTPRRPAGDFRSAQHGASLTFLEFSPVP